MVVTGVGNNEEKLDYPHHIYGGIAEGQYHHEIPKKNHVTQQLWSCTLSHRSTNVFTQTLYTVFTVIFLTLVLQ